MNKLYRMIVVWGLIALAAAPLGFAGDLEIHTIDVGQGASELVIGPDGTTILIDGGTSTAGYYYLLPYLNAIPALRSKHLDYMIASHDDSDHYGGLNRVLNSGWTAETIYHCGDNVSFGRGVQIPLGLVIDLGNGAKATCVGRYGQFIDGSSGNTSDNNLSVCLLIEYGPFDYITAGDLEGNEYYLARALINTGTLDPAYGVDVIHVNHHGSRYSSTTTYVNTMKHKLAVINGGTQYGHPTCEAVDRLKGIGVAWTGCNNVYRTTYAADGADSRRALESDCPTLGDMVITYDGSSPSYYLSGTYYLSGNDYYQAYAIDEPLPPTPPPTRPPVPSPTSTPIPGPVIINEILARVPLGISGAAGDANGDGVRNDWQDEFIELVNWTNLTVNIGGCTISGSSYTRFTFPNPSWIPSGKALVLFGGGTPTGDFGGSTVLTTEMQSAYGLGLNDFGDTVTLQKGGEIYDTVTYGEQTESSYNRWQEIRGTFRFHNLIREAGLRRFSPGTKVNGELFGYEPSHVIGDYNGDGKGDIAIFRPSSGLWAVKGITRAYFGSAADLPVPGDYNGDGTSDIAVFRKSSGLWAVRNYFRRYFGSTGDIPVPGDYSGNGTDEIGIYRKASGLWAIKGVTRTYFGGSTDTPVPGDYSTEKKKSIGIFRPASGLWAIKGVTRTYFGASGDTPVPGEYGDDGRWSLAIFRPASGLWAIKGVTRTYFGEANDAPVPGSYAGDGKDSIGIFRPASGLWAIQGGNRMYFGESGDLPVTR